MVRQRRPRTIDPHYLAWLRTQRCACGCLQGPPCDAAHLRSGSLVYDKRPTGIGEKPDSRWALPLTHDCHMKQHSYGSEIEWWTAVRCRDPFALALRHYRRFKQLQAGTRKHAGNTKGAGRPRSRA